jgi:DNA-binding transcriptional LysR family regulator
MLETWDEIRTAYQVARLGTVSAAAEVLGVHHATVIRHIDALEKQLGAKLFQRHARGYTPTEAGRDLLSTAQRTDEQFSQLASRIKGQGETVTGELVITSITGMARLLAPIFASFQAEHPGVVIRYQSDMRLYRLDYGEAHVAIRAGAMPEDADYVVQPLMRMGTGLYASKAYVAEKGLPEGAKDYPDHRFIGPADPESRAPFNRWLRDHVPPECVTMRISEPEAIGPLVRAGLGLGFLPLRDGEADRDLVEVLRLGPDWESPLWIVTHVDLHRTLKVQAFLAELKKAAAGWTCG